MRTYKQLSRIASDNDGQCVVGLVPGKMSSRTVFASAPEKLPRTCRVWDYFFSDEAEYFDFNKFSITGFTEGETSQ